GEHCEARVHDLHDVVRSDGHAVVRRIAAILRWLQAREAHAEPVEAGDDRHGRARALRRLLDRWAGFYQTRQSGHEGEHGETSLAAGWRGLARVTRAHPRRPAASLF